MSVTPQPEAPASVPPAPPAEPTPPPPPSESPAPIPAPAAKPILNPLQSDGTPPASTLVEPPRSPNTANPAIDEKGVSVAKVANGDQQHVNGTASEPPAPALPIVSPTPAPASELAVEAEQPGRSPLPPDATVPPTPRAEDEAPPVLPADAIPPAVPTPSVITTEDREKEGGILGVADTETSLPTPGPEEAVPASTSTPVPVSEVAAPAPVEAATTTEAAEEPMDIDAVGEEEVTAPAAPGLQAGVSDGSLKRAGDSLDGGPDEKRLKEESVPNGVSAESSAPAPSPAPATPAAVAAPVEAPVPAPAPIAPAQPAEASAPALIEPAWISYVPTPARPSGPTTPLTLHQHKHLLNAVRSLKKKTVDYSLFANPVDIVAFNIPHYPQIIETPMDLGTVEVKLIVSDPRGPPKDKSKMAKWDTSKGAYKSFSEVVEDVRRIWENSRKFNGRDHLVSQAADRLDAAFETAVSKIPPEPVVVATPPAPPTPTAGPSTSRRASVSQPPTIRRSSDDTRPKREIHPPPSKDLAYEEIAGARKPKRRSDPQLQWAGRVFKSITESARYQDTVAPFFYPVEQLLAQLPDYSSIIKRPIDLNIIKAHLTDGVYDDVSQVNDDMQLMFANAIKYNTPGDLVSLAAAQLQQIWEEKWKTLPPKQEEVRELSEDPLALPLLDDADAGYSSEEDSTQLRSLESQVSSLNDQIAALRAKIATRRTNKAAKSAKSKSAKAGPSQRKQSTAKYSPGVNGNGRAPGKKPKKTKENVHYREDADDDVESDEEPTSMTLTQKQELAEKIQVADADTLGKAITIIQQTTNLGANNEEIELDIDSLPAATVVKLYNLVCRGGRAGKRAKQGASGARAAGGSGKKAGRKAMGGVSRKSVNEKEEAERIKRMEAQLQSFDSRGDAITAGGGYEGEDSSSEEESSDEE